MGNEEGISDCLSDRSIKILDLLVARTAGDHREGQHEMLRLVAKAIENQEHLLVQAGTGTGKSLAYLIPACEYAAANRHSLQRKPVLIATATLALQTQIMERDIPRLLNGISTGEDVSHHGENSRALKKDFSPTIKLFKGRANYICKYKVSGGYGDDEQEAQSDGFPEEEPKNLTQISEEMARLYEWAHETETGDRDELRPGVSDAAWRQLSVTSRECLNKKCPMFQECFSETARADAAEADVIVTNHALLALDTFGNRQILPEYGPVIIDEAHELQDRVTNAVTEDLSARMIYSAAQSLKKHTDADVDSIMNAGDNFSTMLGRLRSGLLPRGFDEQQMGIINQVFNACKAAYSDSKTTSAPDGAVNAARTRVAQIRDTAGHILGFSGDKDVVWIRRTNSSRKSFYRAAEEDLSLPAVVTIAPLSIAEALREGLFGKHSVILTSATLTIGDSFIPVAAQIGLSDEKEYTAQDVGSPFDYCRQGILYAAKHLEKPTQGINLQQLQELHTLVSAAQGGALGLFSSYRAAQEAAEYMRSNSDHNVLLQGESTLAGLIDDFAGDWNASLFGTISLWQGVDVPGLSCRLVVIDRIPFPRPDDPLIQAKVRAAEKNGSNGFMSVSAAYAAIKLAQGTGRLIRAADDKGVVAVLDSRLVTARYSGFLKKSLPPLWPTTDRELVCQALARLGQRV